MWPPGCSRAPPPGWRRAQLDEGFCAGGLQPVPESPVAVLHLISGVAGRVVEQTWRPPSSSSAAACGQPRAAAAASCAWRALQRRPPPAARPAALAA